MERMRVEAERERAEVEAAMEGARKSAEALRSEVAAALTLRILQSLYLLY
jgi:hypothetical protein